MNNVVLSLNQSVLLDPVLDPVRNMLEALQKDVSSFARIYKDSSGRDIRIMLETLKIDSAEFSAQYIGVGR